MIIIPRRPLDNNNPELLPIQMIIETRLDVLAVYLRVLRYLGSIGVYGKSLVWEDSPDSRLYIAKLSANSIGKDANPVPAILVSVGGYQTGEKYLSQSMVSSGRDGSARLTEMNPPVSIVVRGRDELEATRLADLTSGYLDTLRPDILASVVNLEFMSGIGVGAVDKLRDNSGNPYLWECSLGFSVSVNRYYTTKRYPGGSPDPRINKGVFVGSAGEQAKEDPRSARPIFAYADFVIQAGTPEDGYDYTVSTQMIFDDTGEHTQEQAVEAGAAFTVSMSPDGNFGDVTVGEPGGERPLSIVMNTPGKAEMELTVPEGFMINVPGFEDLPGGRINLQMEKK